MYCIWCLAKVDFYSAKLFFIICYIKKTLRGRGVMCCLFSLLLHLTNQEKDEKSKVYYITQTMLSHNFLHNWMDEWIGWRKHNINSIVDIQQHRTFYSIAWRNIPRNRWIVISASTKKIESFIPKSLSKVACKNTTHS